MSGSSTCTGSAARSTWRAPFPSSCRCVSQGIEFYAQPTFDIEVGYQANLTFNDTNTAAVVLNGREIAESPLVGSAEKQANFTLFYENDRFLARASYNRRGEVLNGAHNQLTIYTEP